MGKRGRSSLENDEYIVEKILKRRTVNGQKEALVKWKDYSTKFVSFIILKCYFFMAFTKYAFFIKRIHGNQLIILERS